MTNEERQVSYELDCLIMAHSSTNSYAEFNKKVEHIRCKFKGKRSYVYGYDVIYRNVETARVRSTEQETVQLTLF